MNMLILVGLFVFGAIFGSFAGAQVWRLRVRQLREDKAAGEEYNKAELKKLEKIHKPLKTDVSRCLQCGRALKATDLIPLLSWVLNGGNCRYCKKYIGSFEPTIEIVVGLFFALSYVLWPFGFASAIHIAMFGTWLASGVVLAVLFSYDAKWFLLPNKLNWLYVMLGVVFVGCRALFGAVDIVSLLFSIIILSGLYLALYVYSKGRWIGFGDVKLGLGLALFLADWKLALLALFLANVIGTVWILPGLITKKITRGAHVPFGPFLVVGMLLAFFFGAAILRWYYGLMGISFL